MTKQTREFTKDFMRTLLGVGDCENLEADKAEEVLNELTDTSRWSNHYRFIFKYEDKLYESDYQEGATEQQDESPYEYEGDVITCTEVEAVEKIVIDYRAVDLND